MKSTLLYVSLALFCLTQPILAVDLTGIVPLAAITDVVANTQALIQCVVKNGIGGLLSNINLLPLLDIPNDILGQLPNVIGSVTGIVSGLLGAVTGLLSGDLSKVFGVLDTITSTVTGLVGTLLTTLKKVLGTVLSIVDGVLYTVKDVLYCALGPNGALMGILTSVGALLSAVLNIGTILAVVGGLTGGIGK